MDVRSPVNQFIARALIGILLFDPLLARAADLALDAAAGGNASLGQAGNGVPVVNIATPNASGLSHNTFRDYNVGSQGLILNNSGEALTQTQLGGYIVGNPNLKGGGAGLILNEVSGSNPSQLKGYTEVAGQAAHVIVANPHGITCDGCGFINTPRATLSTGTPVVEQGRLSHYDVDGGQISIEGAGLNAANLDRFELITRSARLNAELHARHLDIVSGRNRVDADSLQASAKVDDGSARPALAIDSSALGGMYAGAIRLVGTEAGVGVRLAGDLAASSGDLQIDANGKLSLARSAASGDLRLTARDIEVQRSAYAGGQLQAEASDSLAIGAGARLASAGDLDLRAGRLDNQGRVDAGLGSDGRRNASGDLRVAAAELRNSGSMVASGELRADVRQVIDNRGGELHALGAAHLASARLDNAAGRLEAASELSVNSERVDNQGGSIGAGQRLELRTKALHQAEGQLFSQGDLELELGGGELDNRGGLINAAARLQLRDAGVVDNQGGEISAVGELAATVDSLDNRSGRVLGEAGLTLHGAERVDNREGRIAAERLQVRAGSLANDTGKLLATDTLELRLDGQLGNRAGTIASAGALQLDSAGLDNREGQIEGQGTVRLNTGVLDNLLGRLIGVADLQLRAGQVGNQNGTIASGGALRLHASGLEQQGGRLFSQGSLSLDLAGGRLNNDQGLISAPGALLLSNLGQVSNRAGEISSERGFSLAAEQLDNQDGRLLSLQGLELDIRDGLDNRGGRLLASDLAINAAALDNSADGLLESRGRLSVTSASLDNHGGRLLAERQLRLQVGVLDNSVGQIASRGELRADVERLEQAGGSLLATGDLYLRGASLDNRGALLAANGAMDIAVERVDNRGGEISALGDLLVTSRELDNSGGKLLAAHLRLLGERLLNHDQGLVHGAELLRIDARELDNRGGRLASLHRLQLLLDGELDNRDGLLSSEGELSLALGRLDNRQGSLSSAGQLSVVASGQLLNQSGRILGDADLLLASAGLDNQAGRIAAAGVLSLRSGDLDNSQGWLLGQRRIELDAAQLASRAGLIASGGDLHLRASGLDQRGGELSAQGELSLDLAGGQLNNDQGLISSPGPLRLHNLGALSNRGGEISSRHGFALATERLDNQGGRLLSEQTLSLAVAGELDNGQGRIAGQALVIGAGRLGNRAGTLVARDDLELTVQHDLDNSAAGLLDAGQDLRLHGGALDNRGGYLLAGRDLHAELSESLDNRDGGLLTSQGGLRLSAARLDSSDGGEVSAKGALHLTLDELLQRQGRLIGEAAMRLDLRHGLLDNQGGLIASRGPLSLENLRELNNREGEISSQSGLDLAAERLDNRGGSLISRDWLRLALLGADNRGGLLSGWKGIHLRGGRLDNDDGGTLSSRDGDLDLQLSGVVSNRALGALVAGGDLALTAGSLDNRGGILSSAAQQRLELDGALANQGGQIDSAAGLTITAGHLDNQAGQLQAGGSLRIVGDSLDNLAGVIGAGGNGDLRLEAGLDNRGGQLASAGALVLEALRLDNRGGRLLSQDQARLSLAEVDNSASGTLAANGELSLQVEGLLDNHADGLIYSRDAGLRISAGSLDNQAGTLQGQGDLVLRVAGLLDNRAGQVQSRVGELAVEANDLDNRDGVLASLAGWLRLHLDGWLRNSADSGAGGLLRGEQLEVLVADSLDNVGGRISAQAGSARLSAAAVDNRDGLLHADGLLRLSAVDLDNQNGQIAVGAAEFTLGGLFDNRWGILESSTGFELSAASLDNRDGQLRALGSGGESLLRIAGLFDNRDGVLESASDDLTLAIGELDNHEGRLLHAGTGDLRLAPALFGSAGGHVTTYGGLTLRAEHWYNSSILQARRLTLDIGHFEQAAAGQLLASESLIASGGDWSNQGLIASDGDLRLELTGAYSGNGELVSLGQLALTADSLALDDPGRISAGDNAVLALASLSNHGRIEGAAGLSLQAARLDNFGTLGSAGSLLLAGDDLYNHEGLIFSGQDMALYFQRLGNRYGDIYSLGGLTIAGDAQGGQASRLDNLSGTLEAVGDFSIASAILNNARDVLVVDNAGKYTAKITELFCSGYYGASDCSGKRNAVWEIVERDRLGVAESSAAASIQAGGNLFLLGDTLHNSSSLISAGGDLEARLGRLENSGIETGEIESRRVFISHRSNHVDQLQFAAGQFSGRYWHESASYNPANLAGLEADLADFIARMGWENPDFRQIQQIDSGDQSYAGIIQAGGNVDIDADELVDNSVVRPHFAYVAGGNRVDSQAPGSAYATHISLVAQLPPDLAQQQVNPLDLPGFSLPSGQNGLFRLNRETGSEAAANNPGHGPEWNLATASQQQLQRADDIGSVQASGVQVAAAGGTSVAGNPLGTGGLPALDRVQAPGSQGPSDAGAPSAVLERPAPSHKYLVETNPALTSLNSFLSSDYMLGLLGLDPELAQKRLGDGLYEQQLVRQALVARTGQRYLAGLTSDEAMFRYLMDNAIASKEALDLSVGVALSAAQVAALTHDIVWLEEQEVLGEKVLVPVLYLAQGDGRLMANGALIQGRDVTLISGGQLNNQGTLRATASLEARAADIDNSGLVEAGQRLQLLAEGSIRNAQAGVIAGRDVSLVARNDILNERSVTQHRSAVGDGQWTSSFAAAAGRIEAGDRLELLAGRDVSNLGGVLDSRGELSIEAVRDVRIGAVEDVQVQARGSRSLHQSTRQLGADVTAGDTLSISAGRDLGILASQLGSAADLTLAAGHDLTIASAADERHSYSTTRKVTSQNDQVRQVGSEISAAGRLDLRSGNDLNVIASQLDAGEEAYLYAGNDLNLLAARDSDYSFYAKKKKSSGLLGSSSKSSLNERDATTTIGSSIDASGVILVARQDIRVEASAVEAGSGDVRLLAGNDVRIEHAFDSLGTIQRSSSSKNGWGGLKAAKEKHDVQESQTLAVGSLISGDNVQVQAGRDVQVTASDVVSTHDLNLLAGRDITVDAASNAFTREESHKVKKRDLSGIATGNNLGLDDITGEQHLSISKSKGNGKAEEITLSGSTIGSSEGSVNLVAGRTLSVVASDLVSARDMLLSASDVSIQAGIETASQSSRQSSSSLAVGRVVGGRAVDTVESIHNTAKAVGNTENSRLKAVKTAQTLLSTYSAVQDGRDTAANIGDGKPANSGGSLIKIGTELAYTRSKSSNEYHTEQVRQSSVSGGGTLSIVASGAQESSGGDIHVFGSALQAGDTSLLAKRDVILESAQNRAEWDSQSKSNRTSVGASFNIGQQNGFTLDLGAKVNGSQGKGHEVSQVNSTLETGSLTLVSGQDTTLAGAWIQADRIQASVGGSLDIASRQDVASSKSEQKSTGVGASICVPPFCYGNTVSGSVSLAGGKTSTDYQAVIEQSGLYAGRGGYDITVGDTTRLHGAAIASEATADKNRLSTGRLEHSDIRNRSDIESQTGSLSLSYNSSGFSRTNEALEASSGLGGGMPLALKDSERSTTHSAVSPGTIEIRDSEGVNDLQGLSRDTINANQRLERPDEKAMQERLELVQSTVALGQSVVATIAQAKLKEAQEKSAQAARSGSQADRDAARAATEEAKKWDVGGDNRLLADIASGLLAAGLGGTGGATSVGIVANTTAADTFKLIGDYADQRSREAKDEATRAAWAEGGIARVLLHASAGAIQGLAGGSAESGALGAGVSAALMPAIANALMSSGLKEGDRDVLATLIATGMGVAVGAGDGPAGQVTAGNSAGNVELYNRQLHLNEARLLEDLVARDPENARAWDAAACALVSCADGIPPSDKDYEYLVALQAEGAGYLVLQQALLDTGLFEYGVLDSMRDTTGRYGEEIYYGGAVSSMVHGGSLAIKSGIAGGALCAETFGLGCALAGVGIASGVTEYSDGMERFLAGYTSEEGKAVLNSFRPATHPGDVSLAESLGELAISTAADLVLERVGRRAVERVANVVDGKLGSSKKVESVDSGGAKGGDKVLWGSWKDYPKVSEGGKTYAQVGDRLYTEHAVNRMQPSGLGAPAGEKVPGRNVSPNLVDDVIRSGQPVHTVVDGVPRTVYWSGNVGVVTENSGKLVITILRRASE